MARWIAAKKLRCAIPPLPPTAYHTHPPALPQLLTRRSSSVVPPSFRVDARAWQIPGIPVNWIIHDRGVLGFAAGWSMMRDRDALSFADAVGRFYARRYGMAPMTGRLLGWLMICDPPAQTAAELARALGVSRSAVGAAVSLLERWCYLQRSHMPGQRAERIRLHPAVAERSLEDPQEYLDQAALARRGLELLGDTSMAKRARLLEMAAFADFLARRTPELAVEWRAHREALRAAGDLPTAD